MRDSDLARLEAEIDLLVYRIVQLAESADKDLALAQARIVQDMINEEANRKIQRLLARRDKARKPGKSNI